MVEVTRKKLPDTRPSVTHRVTIDSSQGKIDCYITVGLYEDRIPGEVFIRIGKAGSTLNALLDTIGILISFSLQYGIPLSDLCRKLQGMRFEPEGPTSNPDIEKCSSIIDYVFKWLDREFLSAPEASEEEDV